MRILLFFLVVLIPSSLRAEEVADDRYAQYEGMTITKLTIAGNRITKDFVILRELRLREGDKFSSATLEDDMQRLENLGIFSSMDVVRHGRPGCSHYRFRAGSFQNGWGGVHRGPRRTSPTRSSPFCCVIVTSRNEPGSATPGGR